MRKLIMGLAALSICFLLPIVVFAKIVQVKSTVTKRGVYRPVHIRTSPNNTKRDNMITKGNVNPVTGKKGTKNP